MRDHVANHIASTRRGEFLGDLETGKRWGDRESWQTQAWLAATSHLLLVGAREEGNAAALRSLVSLIEEVDDRADEQVTFEEECARSQFSTELERAERFLGGPQDGEPS